MKDRKNGTSTDCRNSDGTFAPGNPGRPKGARHRVTQAVEAILAGQGEELTEKAVEMALNGDTTALRLCIERIAPARKDSPVEFELPKMENAAEAAKAASSILAAVSEGDLSPLEGTSIMSLVEQYRRTLETSELETRIIALEAKK